MNKLYRSTSILVFLFLLVACSPSESAIQTAMTQSLRTLTQSIYTNEACKDRNFADLAYDIRKTNYIVSPYIGTISGINVLMPENVRFRFTLTLNYQDGKWIQVHAEMFHPNESPNTL